MLRNLSSKATRLRGSSFYGLADSHFGLVRPFAANPQPAVHEYDHSSTTTSRHHIPASADPRSSTTSSPTASQTVVQQQRNALPSPVLEFNDPKQANKTKPLSELLRSVLVFRLCQTKWLVSNADRLIATSKSVFGSSLVNFIIKHTFYAQFTAGADEKQIQPVLRKLEQHGISPCLDYGAEDDMSEDQDMPASRLPPNDSVIVRTYQYEDEAKCDRNTEMFLRCIEAAKPSDGRRCGFAAIKLTALGKPRLLERTSNALLSIRALFRQMDDDGNGYLTTEEFKRVYSQLFTDSDDARLQQVFDFLDTDHDGMVDYVAFTKGVTVWDGAEIAGRCREEGPFSRAVLSSHELQLLDNMIKRVHTLADAAQAHRVRLLVDAEHSYFQPAIDAVVVELQRQHNRKEAQVYNTYQCYLKDVHDRMTIDIERARREGYKIGAKLVRGAYLFLERRHAKEKGVPSPVWDTKKETDNAYDTAVERLLPLVAQGNAEFMVASHNQPSIEAAVAGMAQNGIKPTSPVYFGQLMGMADHLTYTLGEHGYGATKYVTYGPLDEVMPYLIRRAQENSDMLGGVGREYVMLKKELRRRLIGM